MPIDTSIYGMLQQQKSGPGPLDQFVQAQQVIGMLDQADTRGLQRQQLQQQIQMQPELARRAAEKDAAELAHKKAQTGELDMKSLQIQGKLARDSLASVSDQMSYDAWRADGSSRGWKVAQVAPAQFDPNWQKQQIMDADEFLKRASPTPPAGHSVRPDGSLSPIDPEYLKGKEAIAAAGKTQVNTNILPPQKTFENEDKLRADYSSNPTVKASSEMQNAFNLIEAAYKRPSAANDLAMATKYMKILDPTSVVRESEFALAVNATGLMDKVQNYAASVLEGKKLNPAQRKDFYDSAKSINDAFQKQRGDVDQQFSEMATGYGLNPKNVIPSLRKPKDVVPESPKPKPDSPRKNLDGKNYVNIDGKWFLEEK